MSSKLIELMRSRQALGLAEYGVPVTPGAITPRHLTEELLDALVYARALELKERGVECADVWELVISSYETTGAYTEPANLNDAIELLKGLVVFLVGYEREHNAG